MGKFTRTVILLAIALGCWGGLRHWRSGTPRQVSRGMVPTPAGEAPLEQQRSLGGPESTARQASLLAPNPQPVVSATEHAGLVHGRVLDADSGLGLPGIQLVMQRGLEVVGHTRSGEAGTYSFDRSAQLGWGVQLDASVRYGLVDGDGADLSERQALGQAEVLLRVRGHSKGIVRGRIRDLNSLDPVPNMHVSLHDLEYEDEQLVTDEDGRFQGSMALLEGPLLMRFRERLGGAASYPDQTLLRSSSQDELEVLLPVGPTYSILIDPPEGRGVEEFYGEVRVQGEGAPRQWDPAWRSHLHAGKPHWIRLRPDEVASGASDRYELVVTSDDGYLSGRSPVTSVVGVQPDPVRIVLSETGILRGRIQDGEGDAPLDGSLRIMDGSQPVAAVLTDSGGSFEVPALPGGSYVCRVAGRGVLPLETSVVILPGEVTAVNWEVQSLARAEAVTGTVRCASGKQRPEISVWLLDRAGAYWPTRFHWSDRGGEAVGTVRGLELAAGDYRPHVLVGSSVFPLRGADTWSTAREWKGEDRVQFEVLVQDDGLEGTLRVALFDRARRRPLSGSIFVEGDGWSRFAQVVGGHAVVSDLPTDSEAWTWAISSPGYGVSWGDPSRLPTTGGGEWRLDLGMSQSWGALFRCVSADTGAPMEGVRLLLDGVEQGRTSSRGLVLGRAAALPHSLSLAGPWELVDSPEVVAASGLFRVGNWAGVTVAVRPKVSGADSSR